MLDLGYSKSDVQKLLRMPFSAREKASYDIISKVLNTAKFPVIQFSGGLDSIAMSLMVRTWCRANGRKVPLHFFADWGLFVPEQFAKVREYFEKYEIESVSYDSGFDLFKFIEEKGFPIHHAVPFIPPTEWHKYRITSSCRSLKNRCWDKYLKSYPQTDYFFVGVLADESGGRKSMLVNNGFISEKEHGYLVKPIALLTKRETYQIVRAYGAPFCEELYSDNWNKSTNFSVSNYFDGVGCCLCGKYFDRYDYGQVGWLARNKPDLFKRLMDAGMRDTFKAIVKDYGNKALYFASFLKEYDKGGK